MKKFGEDKIPATLVLELSRIGMNPKQKIKVFNQIFLTLMNKIHIDSRLANNVIIEFYTIALPSPIPIFVKRVRKTTLAETFDETLDVEKRNDEHYRKVSSKRKNFSKC